MEQHRGEEGTQGWSLDAHTLGLGEQTSQCGTGRGPHTHMPPCPRAALRARRPAPRPSLTQSPPALKRLLGTLLLGVALCPPGQLEAKF